MAKSILPQYAIRRHVYFGQLPGGRSTLYLWIRRIPDSRHVNEDLWLQRLILKQIEPSVTVQQEFLTVGVVEVISELTCVNCGSRCRESSQIVASLKYRGHALCEVDELSHRDSSARGSGLIGARVSISCGQFLPRQPR